MNKEISPGCYLWLASFTRSLRTGECTASVQHGQLHPTVAGALEEARKLGPLIANYAWIAEKDSPAYVGGGENTSIRVPSLDVPVSKIERLLLDLQIMKNRLFSWLKKQRK